MTSASKANMLRTLQDEYAHATLKAFEYQHLFQGHTEVSPTPPVLKVSHTIYDARLNGWRTIYSDGTHAFTPSGTGERERIWTRTGGEVHWTYRAGSTQLPRAPAVVVLSESTPKPAARVSSAWWTRLARWVASWWFYEEAPSRPSYASAVVTRKGFGGRVA